MSQGHAPEPSPVGLKQQVKRRLQRAWPARDLPAIIVASIGRAGSTLVYEALRDAMAAKRFPGWPHGLAIRASSDTAWDMQGTTFAPGVVYKTHGLPDELEPAPHLRVVFLFDRATDVALSVLSCRARYGEAWVEEHFRHLRAAGTLPELTERDLLRIREQIDGWTGKHGVKRLILHYDALWDSLDTLQSFTGLPVSLPDRRARKSAEGLDAADLKRFEEAYAGLDAYIAGLPRLQVLD